KESPAAPLTAPKPTTAMIHATTTNTRCRWHQRPRRPSMADLASSGTGGPKVAADDTTASDTSRRYFGRLSYALCHTGLGPGEAGASVSAARRGAGGEPIAQRSQALLAPPPPYPRRRGHRRGGNRVAVPDPRRRAKRSGGVRLRRAPPGRWRTDCRAE